METIIADSQSFIPAANTLIESPIPKAVVDATWDPKAVLLEKIVDPDAKERTLLYDLSHPMGSDVSSVSGIMCVGLFKR